MSDNPQPLLEQLRDALRARHYSYRTEQAYVEWARRFILFHKKRHPIEMGEAEVQAFVTHLAVDRKVAASTQNQALSAVLFLYRRVLNKDLAITSGARPRKSDHLPTVLSKREAQAILGLMSGLTRLMAQLGALATDPAAVPEWALRPIDAYTIDGWHGASVRVFPDDPGTGRTVLRVDPTHGRFGRVVLLDRTAATDLMAHLGAFLATS